MASGPDSKPDYLPKHFIEFRVASGFSTQKALAKRLGCSASLISRYERGTATPSRLFLKDLKREFPGLDTERFFRRNGSRR